MNIEYATRFNQRGLRKGDGSCYDHCIPNGMLHPCGQPRGRKPAPRRADAPLSSSPARPLARRSRTGASTSWQALRVKALQVDVAAQQAKARYLNSRMRNK